MSFEITFDIYMVEINWKLSSIDLTLINLIKEKKVSMEFYYPGFGHCILGLFSYFNGKFH